MMVNELIWTLVKHSGEGGITMKIFKYIVFLSILTIIFFVIDQQSDEKGFLRWSISFKIAVLIA